MGHWRLVGFSRRPLVGRRPCAGSLGLRFLRQRSVLHSDSVALRECAESYRQPRREALGHGGIGAGHDGAYRSRGRDNPAGRCPKPGFRCVSACLRMCGSGFVRLAREEIRAPRFPHGPLRQKGHKAGSPCRVRDDLRVERVGVRVHAAASGGTRVFASGKRVRLCSRSACLHAGKRCRRKAREPKGRHVPPRVRGCRPFGWLRCVGFGLLPAELCGHCPCHELGGNGRRCGNACACLDDPDAKRKRGKRRRERGLQRHEASGGELSGLPYTAWP